MSEQKTESKKQKKAETVWVSEDQPIQFPENMYTLYKSITHDMFFAIVFQIHSIAVAFLRKYLPEHIQAELDLNEVYVEPRNFFDFDIGSKRRADVVYRVRRRNKSDFSRIFLILEHKSKSFKWTMLQLAGYVVDLLKRMYREDQATQYKLRKEAREAGQKISFSDEDTLLPPVYTFIVHSGKKPFTSPTVFGQLYKPMPGTEQYCMDFEAIKVDFNQISEEIQPGEDPMLYIVRRMMRSVFKTKRVLEDMVQIFQLLQPHLDWPVTKSIAQLYHMYLANKNNKIECTEEYKEIPRKYINREGDPNMKSALDKLVEESEAKGRAEGEAKGRSEGIAEGEAKAKSSMLISLVSQKFINLSDCIKEKIVTLSKQKPARLDAICYEMIRCEFVTDLEQLLDRELA